MADSTLAQIGSETTLFYKNAASPPVYVNLGPIRSIAGVGVTRSEVESTTLDSDAIERIGGLPDGKQVTIVFTTGSAILALLEGFVTAGTAIRLKIVTPAPMSATRFFDFVPLDYDWGSIAPNTLMEVSLMGRITGTISSVS